MRTNTEELNLEAWCRVCGDCDSNCDCDPDDDCDQDPASWD